MKVTIRYTDDEALTVEEVVKQALNNYGEYAEVEVGPESSIAYDHIYFGLQQLISHRQYSIIFDKDKLTNYNYEIDKLKVDIVNKAKELIDQVIIDNETRVQ